MCHKWRPFLCVHTFDLDFQTFDLDIHKFDLYIHTFDLDFQMAFVQSLNMHKNKTARS